MNTNQVIFSTNLVISWKIQSYLGQILSHLEQIKSYLGPIHS